MRTSEYTMPLRGRPYYRNVGIIMVYDRYNRRYSVGEVIYEIYDEQNFQYIIIPYWQYIDQLPSGLFQGIPGINMDVRRDCYYRVNMTPTFISMRTPSESRENVRELMASVGLDYYDRFEWLLRTEARCGDDNLMVVRKPENRRIIGLAQITESRSMHPGDVVEIDSLSDFQSTNSRLVEDLYRFLQCGAQIYIRKERRFLEAEERRIMLYLLREMLVAMDRNSRNRREEGIEEAKMNGRYTGRKPIKVDEQLLRRIAYDFEQGRISEQKAMQILGINSRSTFYRKLKLIKNQ